MRNLTGQRFGKLVAIRPLKERTKHGHVLWECECDCGRVTTIESGSLLSGRSSSCGCKKHRVKNDVYSIGNVGVCVIDDWNSYFWFDLSDLDLVLSYSWHSDSRGYVRSNTGQLFHRFVIGAEDGLVVDHANGDVRDNRRCNLRLCTVSQNNAHKVCGVKGCCETTSGKYAARCKIGGVYHHIGSYETPEEASEAYIKYVKAKRGDFAPHERVIYYPGYDNGRNR